MKTLRIVAGIFKLMFIALVVNMILGVSPVIAFAILVVASATIPMPKGAAMSTILEVWANYIIERFWKDNSFLKHAYDDSQYVLQGRIVHIPQPGSKPAVQKNRNVFPATAVRRNDTDVVYALDEYTTDPTHIPNIDAIHISYSKQDSVLGDHMSTLSETVADDMLVKWGANSTVVKTTGGAAKGTVGPVSGQTGNRLGFHQEDLKKLMIKMNVDNVPKTDRYILIDDNMYEFFFDSMNDFNKRDFSSYSDAREGVVGKLFTFNIMTRSSVLETAANDTVKAFGSTTGATDNIASLAWQKNTPAFALGNTQLFQNKGDALYYGDIHSALVMAGGRVRRADGKGIYTIAQGTPA